MPRLGLGLGLHKRSAPLWTPRALPGLQLWGDAMDPYSVRYDGSNRTALVGDKSGNSAENGLVLNGSSGNYASAPDSAALSITGDIDLRCYCSAINVGSFRVLISKWNPTAQNSIFFAYAAGGNLFLSTTPDGSAQVTATSTASVSDPSQKQWLRVTRDVDNGAGGNTTTFFTSTDGANWTQLGDAVVNAGTTSIFDATSEINIGSENFGSGSLLTGIVYRAQIYNGIGGTLVFDANFTAQAKLATSFTESSSNAATVTINTSGATGARIAGARDLYQGTVGSQPVYSAPGTNPITGVFTNGIAGNDFDTFSGASATGFAASHNGTGFKGARSTQFPVTNNQSFTVSFTATINSGSGLNLLIFTGAGNAVSNNHLVTAGLNTVVLTATEAGFLQFGFYATNNAVNFDINGFSAASLDRPYICFDGIDDFLKSAAFTLNQPTTVYFVGSQVSWDTPSYIFDGNSASAGALQSGTTPAIALDAGAGGPSTTEMTIGARALLRVVLNGASSSIAVNGGSAVTGNAGTNAMGALTVAMRADGVNFPANITVNEIAIYNVAHTAEQQAQFWQYAQRKWAIAP